MKTSKMPDTVAQALTTRDTDKLIQLLVAEAPAVQEAAAQALTTLNDPRIVPTLLRAWQNTPMDRAHRNVRLAIVAALSHYRDERTGPALLSCARGDADRRVKKAAAQALTALGWDPGRDADQITLVAQLHADKPNDRIKAVKTLEQTGDISTARWLIPVLRDDLHITVRENTARALDTLGWQPPDPQDPDGYAYWIAKGEWRNYRELNAQTLPLFKKALQHPDAGVRLGICSQLQYMPAGQAVPLLKTVLDDTVEVVLRTACKSLAHHATPEAIALLTRVLQSANSNVRKEIIQALSHTNTGADLNPLLQTALQDSEMVVRRAACVHLGSIPPEHSGTLLQLALQSEDKQVRYCAGNLLPNRITTVDNSEILLQLAFASADSKLRLQACLAAGQCDGITSLQKLAEALLDTEASVREAAVQSLSTRGNRGDLHIPELLTCLFRQPNAQLRHLAVDIIAGGETPWGIEPLITALPQLGEGYDLSKVVRILKISDHPQTQTWLIRLLRHPEPPTRREAAKALAKAETKDALPALVTALKDPVADVRRAAAEALGRASPSPAPEHIVNTLLPLLNDDAPHVRAASAQALGQLKASQAVIPLMHLLQEDKSYTVRGKAAHALADIGDKQAVPALLKALEDHIITVQFASTLALLSLGNAQGWSKVHEFTKPKNNNFHLEIIQALAEYSDPRAIRPLLTLQRDASVPDSLRAQASKTLNALEISSPQAKQILHKLSALEEDILARKDTDIDGRSTKAALALVKMGPLAVDPLIVTLPRSTYAHFALGLLGGERAFQALCEELQSKDWMRITAAAKALQQIGDSRAIPALVPLQNSSSAEVYQAVTTALAALRGEDTITTQKPIEEPSPQPTELSDNPDLTGTTARQEPSKPSGTSEKATYYVRKLSTPEALFTPQVRPHNDGAAAPQQQYMQWVEQLLDLVRQSTAANTLDVGRTEARGIGKAIHADGGFSLMQHIAKLTGEQGKAQGLRYAQGYIERWWNGIGEWRA